MWQGMRIARELGREGARELGDGLAMASGSVFATIGGREEEIG